MNLRSMNIASKNLTKKQFIVINIVDDSSCALKYQFCYFTWKTNEYNSHHMIYHCYSTRISNFIIMASLLIHHKSLYLSFFLFSFLYIRNSLTLQHLHFYQYAMEKNNNLYIIKYIVTLSTTINNYWINIEIDEGGFHSFWFDSFLSHRMMNPISYYLFNFFFSPCLSQTAFIYIMTHSKAFRIQQQQASVIPRTSSFFPKFLPASSWKLQFHGKYSFFMNWRL